MKTIVIPPNVGDWSFVRYLNEIIWPHVYWRTHGLDVLMAAIEMQRLFDASQVGASVTISDAGYELLSQQMALPDETRVQPKATIIAWTFLHAVAIARTTALPLPPNASVSTLHTS